MPQAEGHENRGMSGPIHNEIVDLGAVWTAREMERKLPGTVLARRAKWMLRSGATAENALRQFHRKPAGQPALAARHGLNPGGRADRV